MRAAVLLVVPLLLLAGCAGTTDADRDGVRDSEDAFPDDPRERSDLDGDGVGDIADEDADGDGVPDDRDRAPARDVRVNLTLRTLDLLHSVTGADEEPVTLELHAGGRLVERFPREAAYLVEPGGRVRLDANATVDVPDDESLYEIELRVLGEGGAVIDAHPSPGQTSLAWSYDVASGAAAGSPLQGPTGGAADGAERPDAALDFLFETVRD